MRCWYRSWGSSLSITEPAKALEKEGNPFPGVFASWVVKMKVWSPTKKSAMGKTCFPYCIMVLWTNALCWIWKTLMGLNQIMKYRHVIFSEFKKEHQITRGEWGEVGYWGIKGGIGGMVGWAELWLVTKTNLSFGSKSSGWKKFVHFSKLGIFCKLSNI